MQEREKEREIDHRDHRKRLIIVTRERARERKRDHRERSIIVARERAREREGEISARD